MKKFSLIRFEAFIRFSKDLIQTKSRDAYKNYETRQAIC